MIKFNIRMKSVESWWKMLLLDYRCEFLEKVTILSWILFIMRIAIPLILSMQILYRFLINKNNKDKEKLAQIIKGFSTSFVIMFFVIIMPFIIGVGIDISLSLTKHNEQKLDILMFKSKINNPAKKIAIEKECKK